MPYEAAVQTEMELAEDLGVNDSQKACRQPLPDVFSLGRLANGDVMSSTLFVERNGRLRLVQIVFVAVRDQEAEIRGGFKGSPCF